MPNHNFIDRVGQKFNRLTVTSRAENNKRGLARWKCQCSCGNIVTVISVSLVQGLTQSCGCLHKENTSKATFIHGMAKTPEYRAWAHIVERCTVPNTKGFENYGGRGITICDEWRHDFMAFYRHVGKHPSPKHSIDRIDNDGNYEPGNVRWATSQTQRNNNRRIHNITLHGHTMNIDQWAKFVNIKYSAIWSRIKRGWPPAKAIFQPTRHKITTK